MFPSCEEAECLGRIAPLTHPSQYADVPATRRKAQLGYEGKTIQNAPVLDEVVKLRRKVAELLGFDNFADYILDVG